MNMRFWGSTIIVAGLAIGAGMLAIPIATAQLGFLNGVLLMIGCWVLMTTSALVLLETTLSFDKNMNSFSQMAENTLGRPGKIIMYFAFLSFIYALISAYLTGGASMISNISQYLFGIMIPAEISGLLFLMSLGGFIYFSTGAVSKINSILFVFQILVFIVLLGLFMPQIQLPLLSDTQHSLLYLAAPVVLTSFGFHTVIPSLVTYMGDDAPQLKWSLTIGSFMPLICYICWEAVILGTFPSRGELSFETLRQQNGSIGEMVVMLSQFLNSSVLSVALMLFTNLALMTSFLGVSLSLFDFWNKNIKEMKWVMKKKKLLAIGLTFLPPFVFTAIYPEGFERALAYGAIFEVVLCILLPVSMVYVIRKRRQIAATVSMYKVPGGIYTLLFLAIAGLGMVGIDIAINH